MPIKKRAPIGAPTPPPEPETSFLDKVRSAAAMGVRGLSGFFGVTGGLPGAAAGGVGEAIAQSIEPGGEPFSKSGLGRIGLEASLGAIPASKVIRGGQALQSALRGGVFAGAGNVGRQAITQEGINTDIDLGEAALHAAGGGTIGGLLGRFMVARPPAPTRDVIESSAGTPIRTAPDVYPTPKLDPTVSRFKNREEYEAFKRTAMPGQQTLPLEPSVSGGYPTPYGPTYPGPSPSALRAEREAQRAADREARLARQAQKEAEEAEAAAEIARAREGMVPQQAVSETITAPIPGGRERLVTRYVQPDEDETEGAVDAVSAALGRPGRVRTPSVELPPPGPAQEIAKAWIAQGVEPAEAVKRAAKGIAPRELKETILKSGGRLPESAQTVAEEAPAAASPVAQLAETLGIPVRDPYLTRAGASGAHYRGVKKAVEAGEQVPAEGLQASRSALVREQAEAKAARGKIGPPSTAEVAAAEKAGRPVGSAADEEQANILRRFLSGESGSATPEAAISAASAAGGGLLGFATDPFDDPILSAALGAAAGGAVGMSLPNAPELIKRLGVPENVIDAPAGSLREKAAQIVHSLPHWQRFNLLASPEGLAANAFAGPYGSALLGAVEAMLKGDMRGLRAIKTLNPGIFAKEVFPAAGEARDLIARGEMGRAESMLTPRAQFAEPASVTELARSGPGILMTAGDVVARRKLMDAGFSEAEARAMTLTSEPENTALKHLAHLGAGAPEAGKFDLFRTLLNLQFPFRRTPINIAEQGVRRLPGIGFIAEASRQTPEELKGQLVQQGLGAGVMGANYLLGENLDPETARHVRRFSTNLAGRYSLPAAIGFAAGQAEQRGQPASTGAAYQALGDVLPVPEDVVIREWIRWLSGEGPMPRGAVPAGLREIESVAVPLGIERGGNSDLRFRPNRFKRQQR